MSASMTARASLASAVTARTTRGTPYPRPARRHGAFPTRSQLGTFCVLASPPPAVEAPHAWRPRYISHCVTRARPSTTPRQPPQRKTIARPDIADDHPQRPAASSPRQRRGGSSTTVHPDTLLHPIRGRKPSSRPSRQSQSSSAASADKASRPASSPTFSVDACAGVSTTIHMVRPPFAPPPTGPWCRTP